MALSQFVVDEDAEKLSRAEKVLERIKIVGVAVDEEHRTVTVLAKNQVSSAALKVLPDQVGDVSVQYLGHAAIETNPPALPNSENTPFTPCHIHGGRFALEAPFLLRLFSELERLEL
jgi:hypothetical protein